MATAYMNLTVPTVSSTPGPTYATNVNAALTTIDSHNHTAGRGVQIPTAAISINADLGMNGYSLSNTNSVRLRSQAGTLAGLDVNSLYSVSGNLYFNNASGSPIQLTAGTAINAAGFGGWTGDYVAAGAQGQYTTATQSFALLNGSSSLSTLYLNKVSVGQTNGTPMGTFSAIVNGPLQVAGATQINSILTTTGALSVPSAAISGAATVGTTLGVSGATTLAAVSASSGTVSGSLSANALTATTSLTSASAAVSGNVTAGGSCTVTGAVSGASLASTTGNISSAGTVSAAGAISGLSLQSTSASTVTIPSTTVTLPLNIIAGVGGAGVDQANYVASVVSSAGAGSPGSFYSMFLHLPPACTITQLTCTTYATSLSGTNNVFLTLYRLDTSSSTSTLVSSATGVQQPGLGFANRVTTTLALSESVAASSASVYFARVTINTISSNNLDIISAATVSYTTSAIAAGTR